MRANLLSVISVLLLLFFAPQLVSAQIIVEDAAYDWDAQLEYPADGIAASESMSPFVKVEYATAVHDSNLVYPSAIIASTEDIPPRILVEYGTAINRTTTVKPTSVLSLSELVAPRIFVSQASYIHHGYLEYPDDVISASETMAPYVKVEYATAVHDSHFAYPSTIIASTADIPPRILVEYGTAINRTTQEQPSAVLAVSESAAPRVVAEYSTAIQHAVMGPPMPYMADDDDDGMTNRWEEYYGFNRNDPSDASEDADNDGLTNLEEYINHTDPHNADTDGDGIKDGIEVKNGFDPVTNLFDNLVAYYPLENSTEDKTGNGHNATAFNGLTYTDGISGKGANFDGIDDYIDIPYASDIEPLIFTVSVWVKTNSTSRETILSSDPNGYYCSHGYGMSILADGRVSFGTDPSANCGDGDTIVSDMSVNDGRWHHIVAVRTPAKRIYIDGVLQTQTSSGGYHPTGASLRIGMNRSSRSSDRLFFKGNMDEFYLYSRAVTEADVKQLYYSGFVDNDRDDISDLWENSHGLNPDDPSDAGLDSDNDGLTNLDEFKNNTDPQDSDSDHDGLPDGWEVEHNLDPLSDDASADGDNDGLTNAQEYAHRTDPANPDTDGDGRTDGQEVADGSNPRAWSSLLMTEPAGVSDITMSLGAERRVELVLVNNSRNPDTFNLSLTGIDAGLASLDTASAKLLAGEQRTIGLNIHLPLDCALDPMEYTMHVDAVSPDTGPVAGGGIDIALHVLDHPVISMVSPADNISVASNTVKFDWITDVSSGTDLYYHKAGDANYTKVSGDNGTTHSIELADLAWDNDYEWYAESDAGCVAAQSEVRSFHVANGVVFTDVQDSYEILRDYDQYLSFHIENRDSAPHSVLLDVINPYDDLIIGFVGSGSEDDSLVLAPGETAMVVLALHAQDAREDHYPAIRLELVADSETDNPIVGSANINLTVRDPQFALDIQETSQDLELLINCYSITNNGDTITDLHVYTSEDDAPNVFFQPRINHARLAAGDSVTFCATYTPPGDESGKEVTITAEGAGKTSTVTAQFGCPSGTSLFTPTLTDAHVCLSSHDWYCTNRPNIKMNMDVPPGVTSEHLTRARLYTNFTLQHGRWSYRNHDVWELLNGSVVDQWLNTVPSGIFATELPAELINTGTDSIGRNVLALHSRHMNGGHYVIASDFQLILDVDRLSGAKVCATSQAEADQLMLNMPYVCDGQAAWELHPVIGSVEALDADGNATTGFVAGDEVHILVTVSNPDLEDKTGNLKVEIDDDFSDESPADVLESAFALLPGGEQSLLFVWTVPEGTTADAFHVRVTITDGDYSASESFEDLIKIKQPRILVQPDQVDYQSVIVPDSTASREIRIINQGDAELQVTGITLEGNDTIFNISADNCTGQAVAPHYACTFNVEFAPANVGSYSATVNVASNDVQQPVTDVRLMGIGAKVIGDADNDGMPDDWEFDHGLDPYSDDACVANADGIKNLDRFLSNSSGTGDYSVRRLYQTRYGIDNYNFDNEWKLEVEEDAYEADKQLITHALYPFQNGSMTGDVAGYMWSGGSNGLEKSGDGDVNDDVRQPLILIHGWQASHDGSFEDRDPVELAKAPDENKYDAEGYWWSFLRYFATNEELKRNYKIYIYQYPTYKHITYNARMLSNMLYEIDYIRNWIDAGRTIKILAHSMGGLVARSFLEEHGGIHSTSSNKCGWESFNSGSVILDKLITLDTPHHGSPAAVIPWMDTAASNVNDWFIKKDLWSPGAHDLWWDGYDKAYEALSPTELGNCHFGCSNSDTANSWRDLSLSNFDIYYRALNGDTSGADIANLAGTLFVHFYWRPNPWLTYLNQLHDPALWQDRYIFYGGYNDSPLFSIHGGDKLTDSGLFDLGDNAWGTGVWKAGYYNDSPVPVTSSFFDKLEDVTDNSDWPSSNQVRLFGTFIDDDNQNILFSTNADGFQIRFFKDYHHDRMLNGAYDKKTSFTNACSDNWYWALTTQDGLAPPCKHLAFFWEDRFETGFRTTAIRQAYMRDAGVYAPLGQLEISKKDTSLDAQWFSNLIYEPLYLVLFHDLQNYFDGDGDGMPYAYESRIDGLDPNKNDGDEDLDGDGLTNREEYELGTDPTRKDTDGDGIEDGDEWSFGSDPSENDALSISVTEKKVVVSLQGDNHILVKIRNTQGVAKHVDLSLSGLDPSWYTINTQDESFWLLPFESKRVRIKMHLPLDCTLTEYSYPFTVTADWEGMDLPPLGIVSGTVSDSAELEITAKPSIYKLAYPYDTTLAGNSFFAAWRTDVPTTSTLYYRALGEEEFTAVAAGDECLEHVVHIPDLAYFTVYEFYTDNISVCGDNTTTTTRMVRTGKAVKFVNYENEFWIDRDYNQRVVLTVTNTDMVTHTFQLSVISHFDDLRIGFVGDGSAARVADLAPGESTDVELYIHANDAAKTGYNLYLKMVSDDGDSGTFVDYARALVHVRPFVAHLELQPVESLPGMMTSRFRLINYGDTLSDIKVEVDEDSYPKVRFNEAINHARLENGEFIEFVMSAQEYVSGTVYARSGTYEVSAPFEIGCPDDTELNTYTINNFTVMAAIHDWYCTNRQQVDIPFAIPSGIRRENMGAAWLTASFTLPMDEDKYDPHTLIIQINGHEVTRLENTVPKGSYSFRFPSSWLNIAMTGPAQNILSVLTEGMNEGQYIVATDFAVYLNVDEMDVKLCVEPPSPTLIQPPPPSTIIQNLGPKTKFRPNQDVEITFELQNNDNPDPAQGYTGIHHGRLIVTLQNDSYNGTIPEALLFDEYVDIPPNTTVPFPHIYHIPADADDIEYSLTVRFENETLGTVTEKRQDNIFWVRTPFIVLHGFMGAEMRDGEGKVVFSPQSVFDSPCDYELDKLACYADGSPILDLSVGPIICSKLQGILGLDKIFRFEDVFNGFIGNMFMQKYVVNSDNLDSEKISKLKKKYKAYSDDDVFFYAYDWRKNVDITANEVKEFIEQVIAQHNVSKVNILAHSMGGLVTKAMLDKYGDSMSSEIKKIIFAGTPHTGAPETLSTIRYGFTSPFFGNTVDMAKMEKNQRILTLVSQLKNLRDIMNWTPGMENIRNNLETVIGLLDNLLDDLKDKAVECSDFEEIIKHIETIIKLCRAFTGQIWNLVDVLADLHSILMEDIDLNMMRDTQVKKNVQNMASVYQLLPSQDYMSDSLYFYMGDTPVSFDELGDNVSGLNDILFDKADNLHSSVDPLNLDEFESYTISGCKIPTTAGIKELSAEPLKAVFTDGDGDGTVPLISSVAAAVNKKYAVQYAKHMNLPSNRSTRSLIRSLLKGYEDVSIFDLFHPVSEISDASTDFCGLPSGGTFVFPPFNFYWPDGDIVFPRISIAGGGIGVDVWSGFTGNGIHLGIIGSDYRFTNEGVEIFVPDGAAYTLKFHGTDRSYLNFKFKYMREGGTIETFVFKHILLDIDGCGEVDIDLTHMMTNPVVRLDDQCDGTFEQEGIEPSYTLDEDQSNDVYPPETDIALSGTSIGDHIYNSQVSITLSAQDNTGGSGLLATYYQVDGGPEQEYTGAFSISDIGSHDIIFWSVDRNLNQEAAHSVSFVVDDGPPQVSDTQPSQNASDISPGSAISIVFSEDMASQTIGSGSVTVSGNIGGVYTGTVSYDADTMTLTFHPDTHFQLGETINVAVSALVTDAAGVGLDGNGNGVPDGSPADDYVWSFVVTRHNGLVVKIIDVKPVENCGFIRAAVQITDENGNLVTDLTASDMMITVDGVTQTPVEVRFASEESLPVAVALALDYSGSMSEKAALDMENAASEFVGNMDSDDLGEIIKFSTEVEVAQSFTQDKSLLEDAIRNYSMERSSTALYDAIYKGLEDAQDYAERRRAVVAMTDGKDNASSHTDSDVTSLSATSNTPVFTIGLGDNINAAILQAMASETGGLYYEAPASEDLTQVYHSISDVLSNQYFITLINDSSDSAVHTFRIEATSGVLAGADSMEYTSCIPLPDYDGDGIADAWEIQWFGDMTHDASTDPDQDGLNDLQEYLHGTSPVDENSDDDLIPDGWEVDHGLNPLIKDASVDSDGDGFTNLREFVSDSNPQDSAAVPPIIADFDDDHDVDGYDLSVCMTELNRTDCSEASPCSCDLYEDGAVNAVDLGLFGEDYGRVQVE